MSSVSLAKTKVENQLTCKRICSRSVDFFTAIWPWITSKKQWIFPTENCNLKITCKYNKLELYKLLELYYIHLGKEGTYLHFSKMHCTMPVLFPVKWGLLHNFIFFDHIILMFFIKCVQKFQCHTEKTPQGRACCSGLNDVAKGLLN